MTPRPPVLAVAALLLLGTLMGQEPTRAAWLTAQGEYRGALSLEAAGASQPFGAQLVALASEREGDDRLRLVLYEGGLPGDGWARGARRWQTEATSGSQPTTFAIAGLGVELRDGALHGVGQDGGARGRLQRIERRSPTLGAAPPPAAAVLFDGSSAEGFEDGRLVEGSLLSVGCDSRRPFGDHRLHLEFRTPFQPAARGQGRGNSGVYLQGRYECQILDSFGLEGRHNECGGVYSIADPIVNACLPPGQWQTYDVVFTAARWDGEQKVRDARMTVHLNGILVHDDVALPHATTAAPRAESPAPGGLHLQDHGNPVTFRNVWVVERDAQRTRHVELCAGGPSHGYGAHEHKAGCMLLANALRNSGLPLTVTVHDLWPDDPAALERADVLVCFADGGARHPFLRHSEELAEVMARGTSLVCLHYGVEVPKGSPGDRFVDWLGGYFETDWSVNPHWTAEFAALPEHPITRGVQPFAMQDEWYFHMRFRPAMEAVTPILSAVAPPSTMTRQDGPHSGNPAVRAAVAAGEPQHVAWALVRPDGGRAFGFTGAHVHWNWAHDDFRKVVLNAIAWCADVEVPEGGVPSTTPDLPALQQHMDGEPGERFDAERVQRMLDSFGK